MLITIIALGSRGDIQPFVPLGRALQSAGHRVRVATFPDFAPWITAAGVGFHPIRGDAQALVRAAGPGMLAGERNPIKTLRAIQGSYGRLAESIARDLSHPTLRDTQLLLNQLPGNLYGYDLAEHLGVPLAAVGVIPLARTRFMPMLAFPSTLSWLPGYNALTYRLAEQMVWTLFRKAINRWRTEVLGLAAHPLRGPFNEAYTRRIPIIYGFSARVALRPPDWGDHIHTTGWWLPQFPDWEPPGDLLDFLAAGPPPVFIGFGSMPIADPQRVSNIVIEAVRRCGRRAILHSGWAGLGGTLPPEIFSVDDVPYRWLFGRMAAVVHHGGSGTSGFGFHTGVPSLIVPFGFDQFYWGACAARLGVGPSPLPFRQLSEARLAAGLHQAVSDPDIRRRAGKLGAQLSAENGLQQAVELIETLAA